MLRSVSKPVSRMPLPPTLASSHTFSPSVVFRRDASTSTKSDYRIDPVPFNSVSPRRIFGSPTLSLEAVALSAQVKQQIHSLISERSLSSRDLRINAAAVNLLRAPETLNEKPKRNRGQPIVQPPPNYDVRESVAYAALRMPGTFAANMFVMAEAARLLPDFNPNSILDFGAGASPSLMAASRVFSQSQSCSQPEEPPTHEPTIRDACLVEKSSDMRLLASRITASDPWIRDEIRISHTPRLLEGSSYRPSYDIVSCSYSLNEIIRDAIAGLPSDCLRATKTQPTSRESRLLLAEKRLRQTVKSVWSRTNPGGLLVVIEDGTAAGFETVAFVRDTVLQVSPSAGAVEGGFNNGSMEKGGLAVVQNDDGENLIRPLTRSRVLAPCVHSKACPLVGSITRHRICRFQQRLNRPLFSRSALPMSEGYEDEYFSFLVVQKVADREQDIRNTEATQETRWGRLIRQPLLKGKHVMLDACTNIGTLERRVVSKKSSAVGQYSCARRAKWGDVWPTAPLAAPQELNF